MNIMVPGVHAPVNNVAATPEKAVSESITADFVLTPFADEFQGIGCLPGEYSISLHRDVGPVVHPCRVPVPKKDAMKAELKNLASNQISSPATEPTNWVSSVLAMPKKDGLIHVCLDPKDFNSAIKAFTLPPTYSG